MAVDVPDSFIARNKTPPRYPPPRPQSQVIFTPNGSNSTTSFITTSNSTSTSATMPKTATKSKFLSSTTSSTSSTLTHNGGISLDLHPHDSFGHSNNNNAIINNVNNSNNNSNNSSHIKNSPSLDSCMDFSKKSSSKGPSSLGSACESIGFESMSYHTKSRGSLSTRSSSSGDLGPPEYDLGPHRELPVDVPENFVEMTKSPPRYPPPKLHNVKELVKSKESISSNGSIEKELKSSTLLLPSSSPSSSPPLPSIQTSNRNNEVYFMFLFHF